MALTLRNLNKALVDYLTTEFPDVHVGPGRIKDNPQEAPAIWIYTVPKGNGIVVHTGSGVKPVARVVIGCFQEASEDLQEAMLKSNELAEAVEKSLDSFINDYVVTLPDMESTNLTRSEQPIYFDDYYSNMAASVVEYDATYSKNPP
jgi:hypothetical protein